MSSRIGRTSPSGRPAGSRKVQRIRRTPGVTGQTSSLHVETARSAQPSNSGRSRCGWWSLASMPISRSASTTAGCGPVPGSLPADAASCFAPASERKIRSAITLRPLLPTQTKSTFTGGSPSAAAGPHCRLKDGTRGARRPDSSHDRAVHPVRHRVRELDGDTVEAGGFESGDVFGTRERPGDAPDVAAALGALLGREVVVGHHVAHTDAASRLQDAGDLGEDRGLVRREVDHAVGDDDVDGARRERDLLDHAAEEMDVTYARLTCVLLRQREHLVGHVEPVHRPGRTDALRGENDVDPAAGAEVEDRLALAELRDRSWIAAAE